MTNPGPPGTGYPGCGFYLSLSADMVHWSEPQLVFEARLTDRDLVRVPLTLARTN